MTTNPRQSLKGYQRMPQFQKILIANRDKLDSEREVAPLKKAEDAVELDTTSLSIHEVVDRIMKLVEERIQ